MNRFTKILAAGAFMAALGGNAAFADALDIVPLSLAENSGLPPIESLTEVGGGGWWGVLGCVVGASAGMAALEHSALSPYAPCAAWF